MTKTNPLEDILRSLPETAKNLKAEADNIGRTVFNSQLQKADVVTREAFEEQRQILQLALEKLATLEAKIQALESQQATSQPSEILTSSAPTNPQGSTGIETDDSGSFSQTTI